MDARTQEFLAYVQDGGQVEATDWLPDEYRQKLIKFIEMHANSELMGVLPEREWILKAPTLQRKLALTCIDTITSVVSSVIRQGCTLKGTADTQLMTSRQPTPASTRCRVRCRCGVRLGPVWEDQLSPWVMCG